MALLFSHLWRSLVAQRKARTARRSFVPTLDVLEDRCVPALTLVDNGRLVYDSRAVDLRADGATGATGVYWLANANLAATQTFGVQGINPDGSMTWQTALNWVAAMNSWNNGKGYLGHKNWTLPLTPDYDPAGTATQTGGPANDSFGFNFYSSLFGQLFYTGLRGKAGESVSSLPLANRLFKNLQPSYYWGGDLPSSTRTTPVDFSFNTGYLATDLAVDFEFALPEFSVDKSDKPVAPPTNNIYPLQVVPTVLSLSVNPDGQTIHDSALNINWLANANLAATNTFGVQGVTTFGVQGLNADGSMNYATATEWIAAMNAADYQGHNNWRLPTSDNEDTQGYYRTDAEMGELFYTQLGGQAGSTIQLTHDTQFRLFRNFQPYLYWSSTPVDDHGVIKTDSHETQSFGNGLRSGNTDPNELYVMPVFDGSVHIVTSNRDDGSAGSLRAVIAAAQPGDTIEFSPRLNGTTIQLQSSIDIDKLLYIVGPGAGRLTISGDNSSRLFVIEPSATGAGGEAVSISGLTLANGRADKGGAILDNGAGLFTLNDVFRHNQAAAGAGGDGSGGALAVIGASTQQIAVNIISCQFVNNTATGGAGGGTGAGGAVQIDARGSAGLQLSVTASHFTSNSAIGGAGNALGSAGGTAHGGALAMAVDAAAGPTQVTIAQSTITGNSARGGNGGAGATTLDDLAGPGGDGGSAFGGGLYLNSGGQNRADTWTLDRDTVTGNRASSGNGGPGGGAPRIVGIGGPGGNSDDSYGGGIYDGFMGTLDILHGTITTNAVQDGYGGAGGAGHVVGSHGYGSEGFGGGLYLDAGAMAAATADTRIRNNRADIVGNVFGDLGTI
jgi:hypothetical protein